MEDLLIVGQTPTPGFDVPVYHEIPFPVSIPAGAGAVASGSILIDGTYDFVWMGKGGSWSATGFEVEFTYPDGTRMQQGNALGPLVLGSAPFVLMLDPAYRCRAGSRIGYRFTNRTGGIITVDLLLTGRAYLARR